ncbi:hypothetical protein HDU86_002629 [Geranomyces michiganensis]|nr:hypothetical protein HDU86_002629 [Geranomyces michiganensis]
MADYAKYILDHAHRLEFDRHYWLQESIDLIRQLALKTPNDRAHPQAQLVYADLLTNGAPTSSDTSSDHSDHSGGYHHNHNHHPILVQRDNESAFRLYRLAATSGIPEAAYRAAMMIRDRRIAWGGDTRTESNRLLDAAAAQTHPGALHVLATDLLAARPARTAEELKRGLAMLVAAAHAATKTHPHALHDLALIYAQGVPELGIKPDDASAMNLLLDAADLNHAPSLHALGKRYAALAAAAAAAASFSEQHKYTLAMVSAISRAAKLRYAPAQLALSKLFLTGIPSANLPRDTARAFLLARTAALSGKSPAACCVVAQFVRQGTVVRCSEPNREARMWLMRACNAGSLIAKRQLDELDREEAEEKEKKS